MLQQHLWQNVYFFQKYLWNDILNLGCILKVKTTKPQGSTRRWGNTYSINSGVTTMGSDRENPGAPNLNGPNGGPHV
jgi:hypothetical protein